MNLDKQIAEYVARTGRSRALHEEAARVMPGGNSRTTTFFDPYPYYLARARARACGTRTGSSASTSTGTTRA
jgi:hypothetical protein